MARPLLTQNDRCLTFPLKQEYPRRLTFPPPSRGLALILIVALNDDGWPLTILSEPSRATG
jgi:hypothetical protein